MRLHDNDIQSLVDNIYPNIAAGNKPDSFLECTIISTKNDSVNKINNAILNTFLGDMSLLLSTDKAIGDEYQHYQIELLNSLNVGGLPLAHLSLTAVCTFIGSNWAFFNQLRNLDLVKFSMLYLVSHELLHRFTWL
jgi:hypothetical protein